MKFIKQFALPVIIILITLFLMAFLRSIPATKLWNGYTVFYVEKNADTDQIVSELKNSGCEHIIFLENQMVPLSQNYDICSSAMSRNNPDGSDYLEKRNNYFFDKSFNYKVFYIPESFEKNVSEASDSLTSQGIKNGINATSSYPWIAILIVIAFAVLLIYSSEHKLLSLMIFLLPVLFIFSMPFYTVAAGVCLYMYGVFLALKLWNREGALKLLFSNKILIGFGISSVIIVFLSGLKCALVFTLIILSSAALSYIAKNILSFKKSKYTFQFVSIRPAGFMPVITSSSIRCMFFCSGALLLILFFSLFSFIFHPAGKIKGTSGLLLPASHGTGSLPDIDDYVDWRWETIISPVISVNETINPSKPENGQTVSFTNYKRVNGKLQEEQISYTYDQDFKKSSIEEINSLDFPAIEQMLLTQGNKCNAGYSSSSSQTINIWTIILLILALLVPVTFYVLQTVNFSKNKQD